MTTEKREEKSADWRKNNLGKNSVYTLLATVPCPECEGTGIVVGVSIVLRCCGNLNEYGECCNYPVHDQVAKPEQCERCEATGQLPK